MNNYPYPCDKCPKNDTKSCNYTKCKEWLAQYRYRQKQTNAYAEKVLPAYYASIGKVGDGGGK